MPDFSKMTDLEMFQHDEKIFSSKLQEWGVQFKNTKLIVLDNGLGDHLIFKKLLPEIKQKYERVIIASCYNEVFEGEDVQLISIAHAKSMMNIDDYNVYKKAIDTGHTGQLIDVYRKLYL